MKRNALVVIGLVMVFAFSSLCLAAESVETRVSHHQLNPKITAAKAKEIALNRVPGTVVEEFTADNEKGKVLFFVYIIKQKNGKQVEIMIGAEKGDIVSVEEYEDEKDTQ